MTKLLVLHLCVAVVALITRPAAAETGYEGRYISRGAELVIYLSGKNGGLMAKLELLAPTAGGAPCSGDVAGPVRISKGLLRITDRRYGTPCSIAVRIKGDRAGVVYESGCFSYHGAGCGFIDTAVGMLRQPVDGAVKGKTGHYSAEKQLEQFAVENGITVWPRLDGCDYSLSLYGVTAGVILDVRKNGDVLARWDGRCHVPMRHRVESLPDGISPGRYLAAVTALNRIGSRRNMHLKIIAIADRQPDNIPLLDAALRRISCIPGHCNE